MSDVIFISFYTAGIYEEVLNQYLLPSIKKWNLKHLIYKAPNLKDWNLNTRYKAQVILNTLSNHNEDVCCLDADATIEKYPSLLFEIPDEYDLAFHYLDWFYHWRNQKGQGKKELLTGTLFVRNNENTRKLISNWTVWNKKDMDWEQRVLERLISENEEIKVYELPVEYCVVPKQDNSIPSYIGEPVILHHQFSRKVKRGEVKL